MHVARDNAATVIATILYFIKGAPEIIIDRMPLLPMIPTEILEGVRRARMNPKINQ